MKKIYALFIISLFVPILAQAALRVPVKLSPLQPLPADTAPNANSNFNTPGNDYNASQDQIQNQANQDQSDTTGENSTDQPSPLATDEAASSATMYWILILIGAAGLIAVGIWSYIRFIR